MSHAIATSVLKPSHRTGEVFEQYESNVRTYCRTFPKVFARGEGSYLFDRDGERWLDFLRGKDLADNDQKGPSF